MLTIEMKINGTLIGQMYAHNQGYISKISDACEYDWHCYLMDLNGKATIRSGVLIHNRSDGFSVLAEKLFAEFNATG